MPGTNRTSLSFVILFILVRFTTRFDVDGFIASSASLDHIAGRLSSNVAKLLLQGNRVAVVNSEKIMMSGRRRGIIDEYKQFLKISSILHPNMDHFIHADQIQ